MIAGGYAAIEVLRSAKANFDRDKAECKKQHPGASDKFTLNIFSCHRQTLSDREEVGIGRIRRTSNDPVTQCMRKSRLRSLIPQLFAAVGLHRESHMTSFDTKLLPATVEAVAQHGSDVRVLLGLERGLMVLYELPPGHDSTTIANRYG